MFQEQKRANQRPRTDFAAVRCATGCSTRLNMAKDKKKTKKRKAEAAAAAAAQSSSDTAPAAEETVDDIFAALKK